MPIIISIYTNVNLSIFIENIFFSSQYYFYNYKEKTTAMITI